jgi:hypothetical protein
VTSYRYTFDFEDGTSRGFEVWLNPDSLELIPDTRKNPPEWIALDHHQCSNCPLTPEDSPHCPIARNLVGVIEAFAETISFEKVKVTVQVDHGRRYIKETTAQEGVSSLLGIYMVASGCPVLGKLRPMVGIHLPFMTPEEATYRTVSMYLFAQYFLHRKGVETDWDLHHLKDFLEEARIANRDFCQRLRSVGISDVSLNALNILSLQGELTHSTLHDDDLDHWRKIFESQFLPLAPQDQKD